MQIQVQGRDFAVTSAIREHAERHLRFALTRFGADEGIGVAIADRLRRAAGPRDLPEGNRVAVKCQEPEGKAAVRTPSK